MILAIWPFLRLIVINFHYHLDRVFSLQGLISVKKQLDSEPLVYTELFSQSVVLFRFQVKYNQSKKEGYNDPIFLSALPKNLLTKLPYVSMI